MSRRRTFTDREQRETRQSLAIAMTALRQIYRTAHRPSCDKSLHEFIRANDPKLIPHYALAAVKFEAQHHAGRALYWRRGVRWSPFMRELKCEKSVGVPS